MAFSRVQVFSGTNTAFASTVTTSSVTVTAGNLIIGIAEADTVAANGITFTDSKGNAWSRAKSTSLAATFDLEIWYAIATVGGSGYTVTAADNGGGVDSLIICEEWSGQAASPFDVAAGTTGTVSTALDSGATGTTAQANELVIGAGAVSLTTLSAGAGYSNLNTVATAFTRLGFESKTVSAKGTQNATMTAGANASWVCNVATFKELVVGGVRSFTLLGVGT